MKAGKIHKCNPKAIIASKLLLKSFNLAEILATKLCFTEGDSACLAVIL